jgi:hypothetical protein
MRMRFVWTTPLLVSFLTAPAIQREAADLSEVDRQVLEAVVDHTIRPLVARRGSKTVYVARSSMPMCREKVTPYEMFWLSKGEGIDPGPRTGIMVTARRP